ncbi:MAG: hypothetical protein JSS60_07155 [Verrucomicrobia bacterium]|nr:hypothetical protein [Verrucomicrobiota bacterium]
MKKFWSVIASVIICLQGTAWANSVSLFNDSEYTLKAVIYDANGTLLGEFVMNPRDATDWSDNDMNFGTETQYSSQIPYTVNWSCMSGNPYGSCNNVASGSVVTAQSCGGAQECQQQQDQQGDGY